ncbi:hypothetical protein ACEPPN_018612 [Leptodophora sp. 'Broadleaf-Isolate-01']
MFNPTAPSFQPKGVISPKVSKTLSPNAASFDPEASSRVYVVDVDRAPIKAVPDADPEELTSFALKESDSEKNEVYNEEEWMITNYLARYQPDGKCTPTRPKDKTVISIVDWPIDTPNFPSFSRLPVELRRQIYQNALPAPRILELEGTPYYENMTKIWDITIRELEYTSTFARDAMNFMLSSRLAREVFLENYHELELQEETEHSSDTERVPVSNMMPGNVMSMGSMTPASGPPRLNGEPFLKWNANLQRAYVDGKRDTLLFNNHDIKMLDECGAWIDLRRIKKFALGFQHNNFPPAAQSALSFASRCPSLESLNLIIRNPCPDPAFDLTAYLGYGFLELNDQLAYKISDR